MKRSPEPTAAGSSSTEQGLNLTRDSVAAFRWSHQRGLCAIAGQGGGSAHFRQQSWALPLNGRRPGCFSTPSSLSLSFAIPSTIYYFYPRYERDSRATFLSQSISLLFVLGLLYALFLTLVVPHAAVFYNCPPMIGHYRWFALYAFAMVAGAFVEPVFIVLKRVRILALFTLAEAALFVLCAVVPILLGNFPDLPQWLPEIPSGSASLRFAFIMVTLLALVRLICAHVMLALVNREAAWRLRWLGVRSTEASIDVHAADYGDHHRRLPCGVSGQERCRRLLQGCSRFRPLPGWCHGSPGGQRNRR